MSSVIRRNLDDVREKMRRACEKADRSPDEVTLVAVTKTRTPEEVVEALDARLVVLGENRVEEAEVKIPTVSHMRPDIEVRWDMIGHIQSRKAEDVVQLFSVVHSVDSLKLAQRLNRFAAERQSPLPVFLEVNVSGEESKYGFSAADVFSKAKFLSQLEAFEPLDHLDVRGLMTMAPQGVDERTLHEVFARARLLAEECVRAASFSSWSELSMGMTDDYEIAIAEGSTLIRVGRALFGPREV